MGDDQAVVRGGMGHIVETTPDLLVAAEAGDGRELLETLSKEPFDVLLMDLTMPASNPVELIARIKTEHPRVAVLVHSMHAEGPVASRMLKAGASGYITKDSEPEQLLAALRKVAAGGRYIGADLAEQLAFGNGAGKPLHELLSDRESQVFFLLASGKSLKAIAKELHLSPTTARTYKTRIMD